MKIAILTAMGSERALIEKLLSEKSETEFGRAKVAAVDTGTGEAGAVSPRRAQLGRIGENDAILAETGIGKVNAAIGAAEVIREFSPDCIVSTGAAGGIGKGLRVGDVVVGTETLYHDVDCGFGNVRGQVQGLTPRFPADPRLLAAARRAAESLSGSGARVSFGPICSGDRFVSDRAALSEILAGFPDGLAVEMESAALAHACRLYGIPFLGFRVVSDVPGSEDHVALYKDFWGEMAERSFAVTRAFLESLPSVLEG